jgi:hypothetical protein
VGALAAQHLHHPIQNQFDCRKIATGGAVPVKVMNKRTTAYHEAGHAVIARVLTLPCGPATIKPDYHKRTWGVAVTSTPSVCFEQWERRGKVREEKAGWIACIMTLMAGRETEIELLGHESEGDDDDNFQIMRALDESPPLNEERLRRMTRTLIRGTRCG